MLDGNLYAKSHGNPSGSSFTKIVNDFIHVAMNIVAFERLGDPLKIDNNLGKRIKVTGDDGNAVVTAPFDPLLSWLRAHDVPYDDERYRETACFLRYREIVKEYVKMGFHMNFDKSGVGYTHASRNWIN